MDLNKELVAASATPLVLAILAEEENYGYAILKRVQDLSDGAITWNDGMLYPVLHRLQRLGYVRTSWRTADSGRRRKYYALTQTGRTQLDAQRRQWQVVDAALHEVWKRLRVSADASFAPRLACA